MAELNHDRTEELLAEIDVLKEIVAKQTETIASQSAEIAELKERLNKNSKNSSKPPSSDGLNKPKPKSLRKKSDKKQGAQQGHKGSGFSVLQTPDEIIEHIPSKCKGCANAGKCTACGVVETRYEVDIVVTTNTIAHQIISYSCPNENGNMLTGNFPTDITGTIQYGVNLKSLAVSLNTVGMVGIKRTHDILSAAFNIPISTGTIFTMVKNCAKKLESIVEKIRIKLISEPIVHFDETGTRVDKKTLWFHNASNKNYTYLTVEEKRGKIGMDASGVLPDFQGIAVHDCWSSYWKYRDVTHAICCAHLLRELVGVLDNHPDQTWASDMKDLLLYMKKIRDKAVFSNKDNLSYYYLHKFDVAYNRIIDEGRRQNPIVKKPANKPGRLAKGKIRSLVERLANYKAAVCLFTQNFQVSFDNNQAERDVRMVKVKTKVSGCFRTKVGADSFAIIMSYIGTANKQGINSYIAIKNAFIGLPNLILI